MRTEVVNLIKILKEESGDTHKINKHLAFMEHNFQKMDKMHDNYRFVKRILAIFFPNNPEYQSKPVEIDPLERIEAGFHPSKLG